eukprot:m.1352703 g.1352703  ORF g.1352703 m.1352703 type:complete len:790 (-) comp24927_c0_seq2:121-2490(-)
MQNRFLSFAIVPASDNMRRSTDVCQQSIARWQLANQIHVSKFLFPKVVILFIAICSCITPAVATHNASILIRQHYQHSSETIFRGEYAPGSPTFTTGSITKVKHTPVRANCSLLPNQTPFPDVAPRVGVVLVLLDDLGRADLSAVNNDCFWTRLTEKTFSLHGAAVIVGINPRVELITVPNSTYAVPLVFVAWDDGIRIGVLAVSDVPFSIVIFDANSNADIINNGDDTSSKRDNRILHLSLLLATALLLMLVLVFAHCALSQSTLRHIRGNVVFPAPWNPEREWDEEDSVNGDGIEDSVVVRRHIRHISMERDLDRHSPVLPYSMKSMGSKSDSSRAPREVRKRVPITSSNSSDQRVKLPGGFSPTSEAPATPSRVVLVTPALPIRSTLPDETTDEIQEFDANAVVESSGNDRPNVLILREDSGSGSTADQGQRRHATDTDSVAIDGSSASPNIVVNQDMCTVCLDKFEDGIEVRALRCGHIYHLPCIDPWLLDHGTCPLCKMMIVPSCTSDIILAHHQRAERASQLHDATSAPVNNSSLIVRERISTRGDAEGTTTRCDSIQLLDDLLLTGHQDRNLLNDVAALEWARSTLRIPRPRMSQAQVQDTSPDVRLHLALERMFSRGTSAMPSPGLQLLRERHAHGDIRTIAELDGDGNDSAVDAVNASLDDAEEMWVQEALTWPHEGIDERTENETILLPTASGDTRPTDTADIDQNGTSAPHRMFGDASDDGREPITHSLLEIGRDSLVEDLSLELMMPQLRPSSIADPAQSRRQTHVANGRNLSGEFL